MQIDAVLLWVDGNDPVLTAKRSKYAPADALKMSDVAGATRYANVGEIFWCIASLNRFASFLHKIYIITDGQDPHLDPFLEKNFPSGHIPYEIVDHKTIFKGYEEYLPVFNSTSIETMMWRIPGLSEHFILLNDDFVLLKPCSPSDFFTPSGDPICYAGRYCAPWARLMGKLKSLKIGHEACTFKRMMLVAADIVGQKKYILYLGHTPRGLRRSFFEEFYSAHPEHLVSNIRDKFRHPSQYQTQELEYLALQKVGRVEVRPHSDVLIYMEPKPKPDYLHKKIVKAGQEKYKFCCFNGIDQASAEDIEMIRTWIEAKLSLKPSE